MKKASFTYNTLFMTFANGVTRLTGFFYRIFISRFIGAEGLGVFGLIMPIYAICCSIVASGIPVAAMKLVSENEDKARAKAITNKALKLVLILSLILFAVIIIFARPLSRILGDERTYLSLPILAFAVLITGFENVYKSTFYSFNKVSVPACTEIAEQLFRIIVVIYFLMYYAKDDIALSSAVLTFGIFAGELLSFIILTLNYGRMVKGTKIRKDSCTMSMITDIAAPITFSRTAETLIGSASNILIPAMLMLYGLGKSESTSSLGVISGMIMPLLYLPCIFTNALAVNIVPFISSNICKNNYGAVIRKMEKALTVTSLVSFPCAILMCVYAKPIAELLFNNDQVALLLPPMAIGGVAATFRHIFNSVMNACGKAKESSMYCFLGNIVQLFLICTLIPFIGIYGYIAAYLISNIMLLIPSAATTSKALHLDPGVVSKVLMPILPSIILFFNAETLFSIFNTSTPLPVSVVLSAIISGIIYLFIVFILFIEKKIIFFSKIT